MLQVGVWVEVYCGCKAGGCESKGVDGGRALDGGRCSAWRDAASLMQPGSRGLASRWSPVGRTGSVA